MKAFEKLCLIVLAIFAVLAVVLNICITRKQKSDEGLYRVEARRLAGDISDTGSYDLEDYPHLTQLMQ